MRREEYGELAHRIRTHPQFADAAKLFVAENIAWRDNIGLLNRVIGNVARLRILEYVIYLHFARAPDGDPGATFERLAELSGTTDTIGVRAIRTTLRMALIAGLVVATRDPSDGRLRVFQPTPALIGHVRDFMALFLRPLESVFEDMHVSDRLRTDDSFQLATVSALSRAYLEKGVRRFDTGSVFNAAAQLEGALPIFSVVIDCFLNGRSLPPAAELSRRFFVSQSQARIVLKAAEAAELIQTGPRGRLLDASRLARSYFGAHSRYLAFAVIEVFGVRPWATG